ncbi:unnamed protein product [Mesocestoides corti]|nr:unnamed protein product [Mesocestoides corti]
MRLDTKTKMEAEYMEEIEELKQVIDGLRQQLEEQRVDSPPEITTDLTLDANRSTVDIVNQINQLQSELELSQKKLHELESENAILRERIDVLEIKESVVLNMTSENATNELLEEIDLLKTQLMAEKSEKQRLHQQIAEKEDDVDAARGQVFELQSTVKSLREELCDVKAEFDGLKLQTGSTDNTRGNSLFSEVEDRRRRAEALVQKQQAFIDKLQHELAYVQAESRRKIVR